MIKIFFSLPIIIINTEKCCSGYIRLLSIVVNITDESYSLSSSFLFCISNLNVRYCQSERKKKKNFFISLKRISERSESERETKWTLLPTINCMIIHKHFNQYRKSRITRKRDVDIDTEFNDLLETEEVCGDITCSKIGYDFHAVPATQSSVERAFSAFKLFAEQRAGMQQEATLLTKKPLLNRDETMRPI